MSYKFGVGISHLEFWVKDMEESLQFYSELFPLIGWHALNRTSFSCGVHEIYFREMPVQLHDTLGVRHICFHASSRSVVDKVGEWLLNKKAAIIRGPLAMPHYDKSYYTVDFKDPNGFILEVAHAPDLKL
ncbi:VOC family protein [Pontibacter sp. MBLB2868]|uniref:VOC family protein n=1 Tax=Pontibacter sp. MBLB2868 TaxID=3451555 RepID=UPI003F74B98D